MTYILTANRQTGETLTFLIDTIEDAENIKRAVGHLGWNISAMPSDNTDREIARRAVRLEHWRLVAIEIASTDMRLMFDGKADQAERENLAENVFLALVQRGCPDTEASVRCFILADLFIAERDQERSK